MNIEFINSDICDLQFKNEFDVVLNLADGAIGYLENDEENLKIFDVIANALKPGGKHFMDICNAEHAEHYFPKRCWDIGDKALSLSEFEWDKENRITANGIFKKKRINFITTLKYKYEKRLLTNKIRYQPLSLF